MGCRMRRGQPFGIYALCCACVASLLTIRCGGSTSIATVAGPTGVRCQTAVSVQPTTVPPEGGAVNVHVASARDCTWSASTEAAWIQLSATSGQGDAVLTGTVARNELPAPRSGAVVVNEQRVTVAQEPRPCRYELSTAREHISAQGGRGRIEVQTSDGCAWNASGGGDWLRILTTSGTGTAPLEFEAAPNGGDPREAILTVADQRVVVEQASASQGSPGDPPAAPECTFTLRPSSSTVPGRGGDGRFRVDTDSRCEWSASSGASWILVSGGSRTGPGEVSYTALTNPAEAPRSGSIRAGGQTHSVTQEPGPRPCTFGIDPLANSVSAAGGSFVFQVTAESPCRWTAVPGASWVTVNPSGPYGTGSAQVAYSVQPNTSKTARSTTISVGDRSHTVLQAGAP
jgi:hypothetical protein